MLRTRPRWIGGSTLVFAVAACGGGSSTPPEVDPLDAVFGAEPSQAERRANDLKVEEATALCMADEGWEYTPYDWSAVHGGTADEAGGEEQGDAAFGRTHGYGIVHGYEQFEWPYLDAEGNYVGADEAAAVNPNDSYTSSLSEDDLTEYYADLYGSEATPVSGEDDTGISADDGGCQGMAALEVYGAGVWTDPMFYPRYLQLSDQLLDDPAAEDATVVWSDCMYDVDSSYDFFGTADAQVLVEGRLHEAKGLERVAIDPETGQVVGGEGTEDVFGMVHEERGSYGYVGDQRRLTQDQIDELQAFELQVWKADQECRDESGLDEIERAGREQMAETLRDEFPQYAVDAEGNDQ
jgi:hypothetical protein